MSLEATSRQALVLHIQVVDGRLSASIASIIDMHEMLAHGCVSASASSLAYVILISSTLREPAHSWSTQHGCCMYKHKTKYQLIERLMAFTALVDTNFLLSNRAGWVAIGDILNTKTTAPP